MMPKTEGVAAMKRLALLSFLVVIAYSTMRADTIVEVTAISVWDDTAVAYVDYDAAVQIDSTFHFVPVAEMWVRVWDGLLPDLCGITFVIPDSCLRGDMDYNSQIDISDLVLLIDYMFRQGGKR